MGREKHRFLRIWTILIPFPSPNFLHPWSTPHQLWSHCWISTHLDWKSLINGGCYNYPEWSWQDYLNASPIWAIFRSIWLGLAHRDGDRLSQNLAGRWKPFPTRPDRCRPGMWRGEFRTRSAFFSSAFIFFPPRVPCSGLETSVLRSHIWEVTQDRAALKPRPCGRKEEWRMVSKGGQRTAIHALIRFSAGPAVTIPLPSPAMPQLIEEGKIGSRAFIGIKALLE